jgi:peroxiredoxin
MLQATTWVAQGGHDTVIAEGKKAPDFRLKDHLGREITLSQFAGRRHVMLLFYPLDWTPT